MNFSKTTEDLIADFRGLPRAATASSKREPVPLGDALDHVSKQYGLNQPSAERVLVENWQAIFGPNLASRCNPVRIRNETTLIVSVTNQTLRSELRFRKRHILQKIRQFEHCRNITDLVVQS